MPEPLNAPETLAPAAAGPAADQPGRPSHPGHPGHPGQPGQPGQPGHPGDPDRPGLPADDAAPAGPRSTTLSAALLTTLVLLTVMVFLRVPYAVSGPGPTRDTLGEHDGVPLITIEGQETYPSTGRLLLTTVSVAGGPGFPITVPQAVAGWVSGERTVRPAEVVFPPDVTQDQLDERNQAQMTSSQENATVAALEELGYEVPAELLVAGTVEGTGAAGVLREDDVLLSFEGERLTSYTQLVDAVTALEPGTTVSMGLERDGEPLDVEVVTGERPDGGTQLGVFIDPQFDLPVDVTIRIDDIGGPSAGLMFALGIVDRLTPPDEVAGEVVAGTGTMDVNGAVGPIGGIQQKLVGAQRDGADWFLAPADNCDAVVGHVPDGLRVVRVETLEDGREAIEAIGAGTGGTLPTCTGS